MAQTGRKILTLTLTVALVIARLTTYVTSPLWLDALRGNGSDNTTDLTVDVYNDNLHNRSSTSQVDPYFVVLCQALVPTIVFGVNLAVVYVGCRHTLTEADKTYPKRFFLLTGLAQGISALMINYALSGTRSPPYLIALLGNFLVPIQFVVRFFLLHKVPSRRKLLCAGSVVLAEFVCLLPSIFPGLESSKSHHQEGGATGAAAVLFPLSFVLALVPGTMVNALMERSVKDADHDSGSTPADTRQLNMAYYLFSFHFSFLLVIVCCFWVDLIPGYGTSENMAQFGDSLRFNFLCLLGLEGCHAYVVVLGWVTLFVSSAYNLLNSYLLRHSEGANYVMVAMTLRSPLLFLFWTLFSERPFHWAPHTSLSTWLSIGALAVMVPAVILYNTGSAEKEVHLTECCSKHRKDSDVGDTEPLITENGNVQYHE